MVKDSRDLLQISNDDEIDVADALLGTNKAGNSTNATQGGGTGSGRGHVYEVSNGAGDLKNDYKGQTGYDVQIGDGMDIAIHGENGKCLI